MKPRRPDFKELKRDLNRKRIYRDWGIVIIVFVLFNAIAIAFSVYLYLQITQGNIFLADETVTAEADNNLFDVDLLASTTQKYNARQISYEALIRATSSVPAID